MTDLAITKDALRAAVGLTGEFAGTTDAQTFTNKDIDAQLNNLHQTTPALGALLKDNGTKFAPFALGAAKKPLRVNDAGTDLIYSTLPVEGGGSGAATLTGLVVGNGISPFTTKANPAGALLDDSSAQNITGAKTFLNTTFKQRNPADNATLTWVHPAITANKERRPYLPFAYLVYKEGSTIYVKNGMTEAIDNSSTNASTMIQWAFDNLTAGRNYKETVIARGLFDIGTRLNIPSYTRFIIDGMLKQSPSVVLAAVIRNKNYGVSVDSNIEICGGGTIDGNMAGAAEGNGIAFGGVTDFSIHDLSVLNCNGLASRGVYVITTTSSLVTERGAIYNLFLDNNYLGGLEIAGQSDGDLLKAVKYVNVSNCVSRNATDGRGFASNNGWFINVNNYYSINNIGGTGRGYDIGYGAHDCTLSNCYATGSSLDGFVVADSPTADPSDRVRFVNCYSIANNNKGFMINASQCSLVNCHAEFNGQEGLRFGYDRNTLLGGIFRNNGQLTANLYPGIDIRGNNNIIMGCQAFDDQTTKTQRYGLTILAGTDSNIIIGNQLSGNIIATEISDAGTNTIIDNNYSTRYEDLPLITAPANPATGKTRRYSKTIDGNNDGMFIKRKINGAIVEVQV